MNDLSQYDLLLQKLVKGEKDETIITIKSIIVELKRASFEKDKANFSTLETLMHLYPKPKKLDNLLETIREFIQLDKYRDTMHSYHRRKERNVSLLEIIYVLNTGRHEKSKDCFKTDFGSWNYSIRGITRDKEDLRVVVSFDKDTNLLLIVTAFYVGKES